MTHAEMSRFANCPAYKISKAALNALTVQYAASYKDEGFNFLAINPGVSCTNQPSGLYLCSLTSAVAEN